MAINFPPGPSEGDTYEGEGQVWTFLDGAWVVGDSSGLAQQVSKTEGDSVVIGQTLICWGFRVGSGAVTFAKQFASNPSITVTMNASSAFNKHNTVVNLTTTGCDMVVQLSTGGDTSNTVRYIAVGDAKAEDVLTETVTAGGGGVGSGGATVGETFPEAPADGALHYLTVQPVGLYSYVDKQWVQTNGGNSEAINRAGLPFRATAGFLSADLTWMSGNGVQAHIALDGEEHFGDALGSWSGGRFTVNEAGTYRISYGVRPQCTQLDGNRVRGWFAPAKNDATINRALSDIYIRNLSGTNTNFTFGDASGEVIIDLDVGDFVSMRGLLTKEAGSGVTVSTKMAAVGTYLNIEKVV